MLQQLNVIDFKDKSNVNMLSYPSTLGDIFKNFFYLSVDVLKEISDDGMSDRCIRVHDELHTEEGIANTFHFSVEIEAQSANEKYNEKPHEGTKCRNF